MKKEMIILCLMFSLVFSMTFVSSQIGRKEECVVSTNCKANEQCINFKCERVTSSIPGEIEPNYELEQRTNSIGKNDQNSGLVTGVIIAVAIIIGFIILAIILKKKK